MASDPRHAEEDVQVVRELIGLLRKNAEELRSKGLPVDAMIQDLEGQVDKVLEAAHRLRNLKAEDEFLTAKREAIRTFVDATAALPPDLVDGMGTVAYIHDAAEREAQRKRRGRKGIGG